MLNWKGPGTQSQSSNIQKIIFLAYIYQLTKFGGLMSCGSKDIFKNAPCLIYEYSSWSHRFSKSWSSQKYKNLNIVRTEYETKKFLTYASDNTFWKVIVL